MGSLICPPLVQSMLQTFGRDNIQRWLTSTVIARRSLLPTRWNIIKSLFSWAQFLSNLTMKETSNPGCACTRLLIAIVKRNFTMIKTHTLYSVSFDENKPLKYLINTPRLVQVMKGLIWPLLNSKESLFETSGFEKELCFDKYLVVWLNCFNQLVTTVRLLRQHNGI